jgi:hypothetical protein
MATSMKKLLICVTFHYKESRLQYVERVLGNLLSNYEDVDVVVETNSAQSEKALSIGFSDEMRKGSLSFNVHARLENDLFLAWMHRKTIMEKVNQYEEFMYTEDDILLPRKNYLDYMVKFKMMWPDHIPSFIRIEEKDGSLYNTDAVEATLVRARDVVKMEGMRFLTLNNPYHGFWIMPREELKQSMNEHFCDITEQKVWIREIAASYGLSPSKKHYAAWVSKDVQKPGLVEIDSRGKIKPECYSYHLPNNYIDNTDFEFGKLRVEEITRREVKL